jgi:hypothetical protein
LDIDQRDVVGNHIVQIVGDAHPFLAGAPPFRLCIRVGDLSRAFPADAYSLSDGEDEQQPRSAARVSAERVLGVPAAEQIADDVGRVAGRCSDERRTSISGSHGCEQGDEEAEEDRPRGVIEKEIDQRDRHDTGKRTDLAAAAEGKERRTGEQEHDAEPIDVVPLGLVMGCEDRSDDLRYRNLDGQADVRPPTRR